MINRGARFCEKFKIVKRVYRLFDALNFARRVAVFAIPLVGKIGPLLPTIRASFASNARSVLGSNSFQD